MTFSKNKFDLDEYKKNPEICPICHMDGKRWIKDRWMNKKGKMKLFVEYKCLFCDYKITDVFILEDAQIKKGRL